MILNNLTKLIMSGITKTTLSTLGCKLINGDERSTVCAFGYADTSAACQYVGGNTYAGYSGNYTTTQYSYFSLTFGSGTTEPTADDYQMESPYDTTDHFSWGNCAQTYNADGLTKTVVGTITNISEEDLTVSEIGMVASTIGGSPSGYVILISRSLITPVTIEPNETKTFQYTLDLSGIAG